MFIAEYLIIMLLIVVSLVSNATLLVLIVLFIKSVVNILIFVPQRDLHTEGYLMRGEIITNKNVLNIV